LTGVKTSSLLKSQAIIWLILSENQALLQPKTTQKPKQPCNKTTS